MPDLLESITEEDLPNSVLRYVAETAGMDVVRTLLKHCAGMRIDIPMRANRAAAKRYIELNYDGHNAKAMACHLGISEPTFFRLLNEKSAMRPAARAEGV